MDTNSSESACANCGYPLANPPPNFCPRCGQETHLEPLSLREYAADWVQHYLAPGGALLKTSARLLLHPGQLTVDYREGRRNQFVRPLRLVFTLVLLGVFMGAALTHLLPNTHLKQALEAAAQTNKKTRERTLERLLATPIERYVADRQTAVLTRDVILRERESEIAKLSVPASIESTEYLASRAQFQDRLKLYIVLLIAPAFALVLRALYWNRPYRYGDYLVFSLHLACASMVIGLLLLPVLYGIREPRSALVAAVILLFASVVYIGIALRRAYSGTVGNSWTRAIVASVALAVLSLIASTVVTWLFDLTAGR